MVTKIRLEQMAQAKKTHPNMATTGVDITVLKKIDEEANKKVKDYNNLNKSITSSIKETFKIPCGPPALPCVLK